jgi:hypothetical protein
METKVDKLKVKESSIPLHILYNDTINKMKAEELTDCKEPRALVFSIKENPKNKDKQIRFEVLGLNTQMDAHIKIEQRAS